MFPGWELALNTKDGGLSHLKLLGLVLREFAGAPKKKQKNTSTSINLYIGKLFSRR
jgi:hypothetical protein